MLGCLLGQQQGREVDISNSLEIVYRIPESGAIEFDDAFLTKKIEQCKPPLPPNPLPNRFSKPSLYVACTTDVASSGFWQHAHLRYNTAVDQPAQ